jgi:predicted pyridoxine 5'-phosphate oxidase superfamily flavin-nucleotide-binding protein
MDDDETVLSAYVFIETVAAIVIQTAMRQFLAELHADSLRQTRNAMAVAERVISIEESCLEESMLASSKGNTSSESSNDFLYASLVDDDLDRVALDLYDLAAIQIQSIFRGFWVRDCLDVDHYCATVIQRMYRGLSCRRKFARDVRRIIVVQSVCRRNIARNRAADVLTYAIIIQAAFRGYLIKKRYDAYRMKVARIKFRAATTIQSRWRAFVCEAYFIRTLVDVLIVQTVVRKWLAKRKMGVALKEKLRRSSQVRSTSQKKQYFSTSPMVMAAALSGNCAEVKAQVSDAAKRRLDHQGVVIIDPRNISGSTVHPQSMEGSMLSDTKWTTAAARCLTSDSKKLYVKSNVVVYPYGDDSNDSFEGKSYSIHRTANLRGVSLEVESANRIMTQDDMRSSHDSHIPPPQKTSTLVSIWKEKERQNRFVPRNA